MIKSSNQPIDGDEQHPGAAGQDTWIGYTAFCRLLRLHPTNDARAWLHHLYITRTITRNDAVSIVRKLSVLVRWLLEGLVERAVWGDLPGSAALPGRLCRAARTD